MDGKKNNGPVRKVPWHVWFGILLIIVSACMYLAQILIFNKEEETFFLMMQDFAFLPISVLLVTLIIEGVLNYRDKKSLQTKLNMVIGTFFTEMGMELLKILAAYDTNHESFKKAFAGNLSFSDQSFREMKRYLAIHEYRIHSEGRDLIFLKRFLIENRSCVMRLLENPNLLEHETFTELLWAVSHLTEEFCYREKLHQLALPDRRHLETDIGRAYSLLTQEWFAYVRHLRINYPFIFSLVVRINPFDPNASAEIKDSQAV